MQEIVVPENMDGEDKKSVEKICLFLSTAGTPQQIRKEVPIRILAIWLQDGLITVEEGQRLYEDASWL